MCVCVCVVRNYLGMAAGVLLDEMMLCNECCCHILIMHLCFLLVCKLVSKFMYGGLIGSLYRIRYYVMCSTFLHLDLLSAT